MPLINFPGDRGDIAKISVRLWSPDRDVHVYRDARVGFLEHARIRLVGSVTFRKHASRGSRATLLWELDRFKRLMGSNPENWAHMPFAGDPPLHQAPAGDWRGTVTATANGVHTLRRSQGTDTLDAGDWIWWNQTAEVQTASGPDTARVITTHPELNLTVGNLVHPASVLRIKQRKYTEYTDVTEVERDTSPP